MTKDLYTKLVNYSCKNFEEFETAYLNFYSSLTKSAKKMLKEFKNFEIKEDEDSLTYMSGLKPSKFLSNENFNIAYNLYVSALDNYLMSKLKFGSEIKLVSMDIEHKDLETGELVYLSVKRDKNKYVKQDR